MIRIRLPERAGDAPYAKTTGTVVTTEDGAVINRVMSVLIRILPNDIIRAEVEIAASCDDEILAHPLLGLDTLRHSAAAYGYVLTKIDGDHLPDDEVVDVTSISDTHRRYARRQG